MFKITGPEDLPKLVQDSFKALRKSRGITCLHGACKVLDRVEIEIPRFKNKDYPLSGEEFAKSLLAGKVFINGERAEVKMLASSEDELIHYLKSLENLDSIVKKDIIIMGIPLSLGLTGLLTSARAIYWIVFRHEPSPSPALSRSTPTPTPAIEIN